MDGSWTLIARKQGFGVWCVGTWLWCLVLVRVRAHILRYVHAAMLVAGWILCIFQKQNALVAVQNAQSALHLQKLSCNAKKQAPDYMLQTTCSNRSKS